MESGKVVPKDASMDLPAAADMVAVTSHADSYSWPSLGGLAPIDLALRILLRPLFEELGIRRAEPGEVAMKPHLLDMGRWGGTDL